ncbi:MAG: acetyl-CoA carboxylase, biotin carboxyl carrier protein [Candidatus Poribacteria bacterium]|nr:acetyl-CoA carboxylase, biotin carboxyl carrier protein [Candidatus Poribacteria bacterium]
MKQKKQSEKVDSPADTEVTPDPLLQRLEELIAIAEKSDLTTVRIRDGEVEIEISRGTVQPASISSPIPSAVAPTLVTEDEAGDDIIRSPMPARFYRAPAPDEPPFIEIGDTVTAGASLATLEVMKTFNDVEAPFDCEVLEILIEDGEAVEYNQPLFRVRRT